MAEVWAGLFLAFLALLLVLHFFGLPSNWLILSGLGLWKWTHPDMTAAWGFFILLFVLCVAGEVVEFAAQYLGARRFGGTNRGAWAAVAGAIAGGIFGAAFFFGLGAIPGSLFGAFAASLLVEIGQGRSFAEAKHAAMGAMWSKVFGTVAKIGLGVFMLKLSIGPVWPG
ncbi:MAG TPA: DUF456 domain-containing protein [Desulfonatronum sp.]|nr:DUF456 domain-containing protein [Desulfonatronum sp.]